MIAYISGEAARGVLLRGGEYRGFVLDEDSDVPLRQPQLPAFFMHAWDIQAVECSSDVELRSLIEKCWRSDRAFRLTLIAFDTSYSDEVRSEAANCADDLLAEEECRSFLVSQLYARPLPDELDIQSISEFLDNCGARLLADVFESLVLNQSSIRNCVAAWAGLPDELFQDEAEREEVRSRVIKTGAFFKFATSESGNNDAIFRILADPVLAARPARARKIFDLWAAQYKEMPSRASMYFPSEVNAAAERSPTGSVPGFVIYQRVKKQKLQIRSELAAGHFQRADMLIDALVSDQRRESSAVHLAKSLCDLAIFCRDLGDVDRYLSLTLRALDEAPGDAWAYAQLGSAYVAKSDFPNAMEAFEQARIYGEDRVALVGRAEAMKYLGQKDLALQQLEECIKLYPNDPVAKNSRASLLAHFGMLEESLELYNELTESPFADAHVFGGRASVLADLERFEEAIRDQDVAIALAEKGDVVPYCAKSDILRESGMFDEALAVLDRAERRVTTILQLEGARARVLRDIGDFDRCERVLRELGNSYPYDIGTRVAIAELYRKKGRLDAALALFLGIEADFSHSKPARNSLAATFAALGRLDEAVTYLPIRSSSTRGDWVGQHIRAMIDVKRGDFITAEALLVDGVRNCPWPQQKPHFASALAALRIRLKNVPAALEALDEVRGMVTAGTVAMVAALRTHALVLSKNAWKDSVSSEIDQIPRNPVVLDFLGKLREACIRNKLDDVGLLDAEWNMLIALAA